MSFRQACLSLLLSQFPAPYQLQLDAAADGQTAQLRIEPLHATRAGELGGGAGWLRLELPKYPVIPDVKIGDTVALYLLVNPATGQKLSIS